MKKLKTLTTQFWFLFAVLLFGVALFVFCSGKKAISPEVTLAAALLPSEQTKYVNLLEGFTEKTGIAVKLVPQQYSQIRSTIEVEAQAGRGELDVAELDVYLLPITQPYMQALDLLLETHAELSAHVQENAWAVCLFGKGKKLFYIPHRLNWQALIYDEEVLGEPPSDWDALMAVAKQHPGSIGFKCARYEGLACDIFPFIWQAGGDPLQPDNPASLKAMTFLKSLGPYLNSTALSYKENSILQAQEHREIILHPNWPFAVPLLRQKGLLPQRLKTAPLPRGPVTSATILGGGYLGIPITAPHPREAAQLLSFLTSSETQQQLVAQLGWFPIRQEGWQGMTEQDKRDFAGFLSMKDAVRARPNVLYYEQASQIWQDGFYRVVFENEDPAATLRDMQKQIDVLAGN